VFTIFLTRAKTPPRLTKLGVERSKELIDPIGSPPYPSNTSITNATTGGTVHTGIAGGERIAGSGDGVGREKQKSTLSPHN